MTCAGLWPLLEAVARVCEAMQAKGGMWRGGHPLGMMVGHITKGCQRLGQDRGPLHASHNLVAFLCLLIYACWHVPGTSHPCSQAHHALSPCQGLGSLAPGGEPLACFHALATCFPWNVTT